jgi:FdhD protein
VPDDLSPVRPVDIARVNADGRQAVSDLVAAEEPLEIRLQGESFAIVMRTPGDDQALAAGFLFSERVIRDSAEIGAVEHCRHPDRAEAHNVVDVFLRGAAVERGRDLLTRRRRETANSSCGVCGRASIDDLSGDLTPIDCDAHIASSLIAFLPGRLREMQTTFSDTGGLHGAALFALDGTVLGAAEDVGRHNAVDKIVGHGVLDGSLPYDELVLMVSGRVSFEIVQKAAMAGIPVLCAVSAPSSLAVDAAERLGVTLVGFLRDGSGNVYTHRTRIDPKR